MTAEPQGTTAAPGDPMTPPGVQPRQCTATAKSTGRRCGHLAMLGQAVCRHHGGASPQARAAAERRMTEARAAEQVSRLGGATPLTDPIGELTRIVGRIVAMVDVLTEQVDRLPVGGAVDTAQFAALERAFDRASRVLVDVNRLGLEERRIELDEQRAQMAAIVIERLLRRHGIDTTDLDVRAAIATESRAVAAETMT